MNLLLLALVACGPATMKVPDDSGDPSADDTGEDSADDSAADDSDDPPDTSPIDDDGDGAPQGVDCDDSNDRVYPGAEEVFDGWDNDCDGTTDANGDYTGTFRADARASYRGDAYDFRLRCPTELSRVLSDFTLLVVCETDPDDADAALLLGSCLEMRADDPYLWEHEVWTGRMEITSSNGWDTFADGTLRWSSMDDTTLEVELAATWLSIAGEATLTRAP